MKKLSDLDDEFLDLDEEDLYEDSLDDGNYDDESYSDEDYEYDDEDYEDDYEGRMPDKRVLIPVIAVVALLVVTVLAVIFMTGRKKDKPEEVSALPYGDESVGQESEDTALTESVAPETEEENDTLSRESTETEMDNGPEEADTEEVADDPQSDTMSTDQGTEVNVTELLSSGSVAETDQVTIGIDVARYQGTIDWAQVAASGIDFAMVRVGYRADKSREICADTNAKYNMQEAQKNGIKVGAYFFSTAVSAEEAKAEADWVADYISQYQITYPVAYDCEGFDKPESAQYNLTNAQRTDIAIAFLQEIYNRGYTPMFYSSMGELSGSAKWDTERIEGTYRIWVSQYPSAPYPQTARSSYTGAHAMWQYTNRGTVAGISRPVDVNVAYFGYEGTADAQSTEAPEEVKADAEALMNFTQVSENVTAKESTNLRNIPSQGSDSTVVYTLQNGETIARTGVSDSGWSRLELNGQTVYAVSSYLTANIEVNLRALPSVTNPDAAVVAVLHNGEYVTRTGINEEYGWSRVDYNGQTLYCISSYLTN